MSWLSARARDAAGLFRTVGILPSVLAVLSAPSVAAAAVRVAKLAGRSIVRIAKAAWTGIKGLLGRCGSTGKQITESLSRTGTVIANAVKVVVGHPMMAPVVHALKATLALVRPVSQGFVANRLLAALVPVLWLRAVIGFMFIPFLVDSNVVGTVWDWATTRPANADQSGGTEGTDDGDLLINTFAIPMPGRTVPSDGAEQTDAVDQDDEGLSEEEPSFNRASRRAQQREDAHAWRMQHPRS